MPLAAEMDTWLKEPSKETYIGYAEDLGNGPIARLQVITEEQKINMSAMMNTFQMNRKNHRNSPAAFLSSIEILFTRIQ